MQRKRYVSIMGLFFGVSSYASVSVRGFVPRHQEQSNWCWIAVTQMAFEQETGLRLQQCKMASFLLGAGSYSYCCSNKAPCNQPGDSLAAIKKYNLVDGRAFETKAMSTESIKAYLSRNRIVFSIVQHNNPKIAVGHIITIHGVLVNKSAELFDIYDPSWGPALIKRRAIESYHGIYHWTQTVVPGNFKGNLNDYRAQIQTP